MCKEDKVWKCPACGQKWREDQVEKAKKGKKLCPGNNWKNNPCLRPLLPVKKM